MGLTPLDIHNKEFPIKRFGGYAPDAVDDFLDEVIQQFEHLIKENNQLKTQVTDLEAKLEQYRSLEESIQKTLVVAQDTAEELRMNAKREAELIIRGAKQEAARLIQNAHEKTREILRDNADLVVAVQTLRTQVRALLTSQLQAIDSLGDPLAQITAQVGDVSDEVDDITDPQATRVIHRS